MYDKIRNRLITLIVGKKPVMMNMEVRSSDTIYLSSSAPGFIMKGVRFVK